MTTLATDYGIPSPGLADLRPATPKRWPINTDVIDSPACAMAQFADYPTHYYLTTGSIADCSAPTLDELLAKGVPWARRGSRIVRVPMVPYYEDREGSGRPVGSAPISGGGPNGECGASVWVRDPEGHYARPRAVLKALGAPVDYIQDRPLDRWDTRLLQAWWVNGIAAKKPALDGFWVTCERSRAEHGEMCGALDFEWNWRDYAPWHNQGHDTQLDLF